ncbi:MAG: sugar ABC transporter permease [Acholeplasmatales bacterium]|jgi:multiple sugar transport system permease protein|nr:sugar ABC transporter permease [Acholeplasmatales bacterium]
MVNIFKKKPKITYDFEFRKSKLFRREKIISILFIALPLLGFLIFTVFSMVASAAMSFTDFKATSSSFKLVGFKNYIDLFTNPIYSESFKRSIKNTLLLMIGVPIGMIAGLILATFLNNKKIKGRKFFRILFYFPAISGAVAINIIWRYIFNNEYGLAGFIFGKNIHWLSDPVFLKVALIIKGVWNGLGGTMLLYLAGMQGISSSLYEVAELDGANEFQKFMRITFPLITPVTFYLLITGVIGGLQSYADSQVFAQGHQEAQTIVFFIWSRGIDQGRYGIATAASVILSVAIMIVTVIQFRLSNKWVYEN